MPETIEDAKQKQLVRVYDVLVFSPILIYIGMTGNLTKTLRYILVILGIGTIIYNGYYYLKYRK